MSRPEAGRKLSGAGRIPRPKPESIRAGELPLLDGCGPTDQVQAASTLRLIGPCALSAPCALHRMNRMIAAPKEAAWESIGPSAQQRTAAKFLPSVHAGWTVCPRHRKPPVHYQVSTEPWSCLRPKPHEVLAAGWPRQPAVGRCQPSANIGLATCLGPCERPRPGAVSHIRSRATRNLTTPGGEAVAAVQSSNAFGAGSEHWRSHVWAQHLREQPASRSRHPHGIRHGS